MNQEQRLRAFAIAFVILVDAGSSPAQVAADVLAFGPPTLDPVVVAGPWSLACSNPASFDFGGRRVVFASNAVVAMNGCTIRAARIEVEDGARLYGAAVLRTDASNSPYDGAVHIAGRVESDGGPGQDGGDILIDAAGPILVTSSGVVVARPGVGPNLRGGVIEIVGSADLDVAYSTVPLATGDDSATHKGGDILISATGDVRISRMLDLSADRRGGSLSVASSAGSIELSDFVRADAEDVANDDYDDGVVGGAVTLAAAIDVRHLAYMSTSGAGVVGAAGSVVVTAGRDVVLGSIEAQGIGGHRIDVAAGRDFRLTGSVFGSGPAPTFYAAGAGADFAAVVGGRIQIDGAVDAAAGSGAFPSGGDVTLAAPLGVVVGVVRVDGGSPGSVTITAAEGDVTVVGVSASAVPWEGAAGGVISIEAGGRAIVQGAGAPGVDAPGRLFLSAGGDIDLGGAAFWSVAPAGSPPYVTCVAGGGLEINGPVFLPSSMSSSPVATIEGCRIRVNAAISPYFPDGHRITFVVGDEMTVRAPIDAGSDGQVTVRSRRSSAFVPEFGVGGSISPAIAVILDPTIPPCLASGRAAWSVPETTVSGDPLSIVLNGAPNRPVLIGVATSYGHVDLGALGCTQIDPYAAWRLADPGILGPSLANSTTDGLGEWRFVSATPPGLAGLFLVFDGYVFDPSARNGVFDQPPAGTVLFY